MPSSMEKRVVPSGITPCPWVERIDWQRLVLRIEAVFALAAFGRVERDDVIARFQRGDPWPDLEHDARAFMAQDRGEQPFGIGARQGEFIGVAKAGGLDLDQDLARLGAVQVDVHDFKRLARLQGDGGCGAHCWDPPVHVWPDIERNSAEIQYHVRQGMDRVRPGWQAGAKQETT